MKNYIVHKFVYLFVISALVCNFSCTKEDEEEEDATLEVTVTDAITGNPRSNIIVGVYPSEQDANDRINLVKSTQNTDASGNASFYSLGSYSKYWISAQATNTRNIMETSTLQPGSNAFGITIN